jgi:hypothetical protein
LNTEKLRNDYQRLGQCKDINDCFEIIDIYSNFLLLVIEKHYPTLSKNEIDKHGSIIVQMILMKLQHLRQVIQGVNTSSSTGFSINDIIDPAIVAGLVRNLYETVGIFNLLYLKAKTDDEKLIAHNLWKISGLKYRQKFKTINTTFETNEKIIEEQKLIENLTEGIKQTNLFLSLTSKNQNKIFTRIETKEYMISFDKTSNITCHTFSEIPKILGIKGEILKEIYTYFSLYSHPSFVSVFQFSAMFQTADKAFIQLTTFNLKNLFVLTSAFIADYIKAYPIVLETFNNLPIQNQNAINCHNTMARGIEYSINDCYLSLE